MKEFLIIISSTWKFAATFPIAVYIFKMSFFETILYTNIGGLIGLVVFTLASKGIIRALDFLLPSIFRRKGKPKRRFTKRNRRIIEIKGKYGLPGIILLTHVLLSIPVGVFLNTKYYGKKRISYFYLVLAQIVWSFAFTIFFIKVRTFIPL
jgi:hypothetical protein